jgi:hydroxymethylbilane synthase
MTVPIRVGTRRSLLATTQAGHVADLIRTRLGRETELVEITTAGDRTQAAGIPLTDVPASGTGVFVGALRDALLDGRVDVAVHSLKDLPTYPAAGITLAAVPEREDSRDVVVARDGLTLGELPVGSRVGTGSPRRVAQLHALGLGLELVGVRGNIDTRVRKVHDGELDAREPWRSSAAATTRWPPSWPASTTPAPAPPSRPSAPCWPPSRAAAPPRSGCWPTSSRATTETSCG